MGLILKLKKNQRPQWPLFFNEVLDLYCKGKFIALPFGKSGYGLIANPFDDLVIFQILQMQQQDSSYQLLFLGKNFGDIEPLVTANPLLSQITTHLGANEIIYHVSAQNRFQLPKNPSYQLPEMAWEELTTPDLQFMIPPHPIIQDFLSYMKKKNQIPLLLGFFLKFDKRINLVSAEDVLGYNLQEIIGAILKTGTLQKRGIIQPPTEVRINASESAEILVEGLVNSQSLDPFLP